MGPPITNRPVGLMWYLVSSSSRLAGMVAWMTCFRMSLRSSSLPTFSAVLGGNHDCVHPDRLVVLVVFDRHLRFAVGTQIRKPAMLANFGEPHGQLVGQRNRGGHQLRGFVAGIAKHHSLVAGAAGVDAHGDVAGLLVDAGDHGAGVGVEAVERVVVADGGDRASNQRLEIHVSLGGDFAGDDDQAGGGQGFAGHAAGRIFGQAGIEDSVRNLVGDLVGMAFGHGFGRKKIAVLG